jgi:hypothetical protein
MSTSVLGHLLPHLLPVLGRLLYNRLHEIAVQEPEHAGDPFAGRSSESLIVVLRAGGRSVKCLAKGL